MQQEYREYIEMWVHEIKTPIASSRLLIENHSNEVTRKLDMQLSRIEGFVEQVLYYARSDEVGKDYIIQKMDLEEAIRKIIRRNHKDFIAKKISLEVEQINQTVYSDPKWVEFILNQIISNAIKYTKGEKDKIKIEAKEAEHAIILSIEDNGVGISEKDINRVFEKGFTGENGRKFGKSTGIGLYLCKKLCDRLGLGLHIYTKVNKGTQVMLVFPKAEQLIMS